MAEAYIPLYRKYRPQSLGELVGQGPVSQTITNAIEMNRIAHAYLFTGSRGTGKTSSARILAKSLNCEQGPTATPCQVCDSCINITNGNDLDVIEFDAASNNGVDEARNLTESAQFAPIAGRYKIYIIDEVHMLSNQAFNALLKTIEEPPPKVVFIFATTEAHKVLPTIISRCQRFNFNRIATPDIIGRLQEICGLERLSIEDAALSHIARQSRGGMRDALSTLDQLAVLARSQNVPLSLKQVIDFLGQVDEDAVLALVEALLAHTPKGVLEQLATFTEKGVEAPQVLTPAMMTLRHLLVVLAMGTDRIQAADLDVSEVLVDRLKVLAETHNSEQVALLLGALNHLEQDLKRAHNAALSLEVGLLSACMNTHALETPALLKRIEALEARLQGGAVAPTTADTRPAPKINPRIAGPPGPPPMVMQPAPMGIPHPNPPPNGEGVKPQAPAPIAPHPQPQIETRYPHENGNFESANQQNATQSGDPSATLRMTTNNGDLQALHQQICAAIQSGAAKPLFIQHTWIHAQDNHKITLACKSSGILKLVQTPDKLGHYREAASKILGSQVSIAFETSAVKKPSGPSPSPPRDVPPSASRGAVAPPATITSAGLPMLQLLSMDVAEAKPQPQRVSPPPPLPLEGRGGEEAYRSAIDDMESVAFDNSKPVAPEGAGSPREGESSGVPARQPAQASTVPVPNIPPKGKGIKPIKDDLPPMEDEAPPIGWDDHDPMEGNPSSDQLMPSPSLPLEVSRDNLADVPFPVTTTQAFMPQGISHSATPLIDLTFAVNGSGTDWAESQQFVRDLLKATPLDEFGAVEEDEAPITAADALVDAPIEVDP